MSELRECPFCGSTDIRRDIGWLECNSCGCYGPNAEVNDDDTISLSAIAAWNRRSTPKPAPEALHGYWQVEPIEAQPPTITTTYCQGCQEKGAEIAKSQRDYAELSERVEQFRAEAEDVAEKREAELASLRQEKNEAIGAALQVEQRNYDQAQELKALRELREACWGLAGDMCDAHYEDDCAEVDVTRWYDTLREALGKPSLAACDEASAPTEES